MHQIQLRIKTWGPQHKPSGQDKTLTEIIKKNIINKKKKITTSQQNERCMEPLDLYRNVQFEYAYCCTATGKLMSNTPNYLSLIHWTRLCRADVIQGIGSSSRSREEPGTFSQVDGCPDPGE